LAGNATRSVDAAVGFGASSDRTQLEAAGAMGKQRQFQFGGAVDRVGQPAHAVAETQARYLLQWEKSPFMP
jgi:hypothetical protein